MPAKVADRRGDGAGRRKGSISPGSDGSGLAPISPPVIRWVLCARAFDSLMHKERKRGGGGGGGGGGMDGWREGHFSWNQSLIFTTTRHSLLRPRTGRFVAVVVGLDCRRRRRRGKGNGRGQVGCRCYRCSPGVIDCQRCTSVNTFVLPIVCLLKKMPCRDLEVAPTTTREIFLPSRCRLAA